MKSAHTHAYTHTLINYLSGQIKDITPSLITNWTFPDSLFPDLLSPVYATRDIDRDEGAAGDWTEPDQ